MGTVEFNDRRGEGRLIRAEDKAKKVRLATKAQYEKHLADTGQEEQRVAEVRTRQGENLTMSGDEYDAWKADQPRGSHRVTFRTVVRKKS